MFACAPAAAEDNTDICLRDIDPFVKYLRRDDGGIFAGVEAFKNLFTFFGFGLMRNCRQQVARRDAIGEAVASGEDQDSIFAMLFQQGFKED